MLLIALAPASLSAGPFEGTSAATLVLLSQKSVLDDFGEEEEEPLKKTPSGSQKEPESEKTPESDAPSEDTAPAGEEEPATETPSSEEPSTETPSETEEPADEMEEPMGNEEAEEPPGTGMPEAPSGGPSSPLDAFEEEEELPLRGGGSPPRQDGTGQTPKEPAEEAEPDEEPVCDEVTCRRRPLDPWQSVRVVLFRDYLGRRPTPAQRRDMETLEWYSPSGKSGPRMTGWEIDKIIYYEERMGEQAAEKVRLTFSALAEPGRLLDFSDERVAEDAQLAEEILNTAIAEHDSAIQRRLRRGPEWNEHIRRPLLQARLNLRLSQLDQWIAEGAYQEAESECSRLAGEVRSDSALLGQVFSRVEKLFKIRSDAALQRQDYAAVRGLLEQWGSQYPEALPQSMKVVQDDLVSQATELARRAEAARESSPQEALELLARAATIWPPLGQIDELRRRMDREYPILNVAYSELPRNLTPMTARSAVERHAISLIFERLVRWVDDPESGAHYACQLAARRPEPLERGRQFELRRTNWSDSTDSRLHFCTVEDVRRTLQVMRAPECPGYSPAWSSLLAGVDNVQGEDPFRAKVWLANDHWQPLSLMDFHVLPASCFRNAGAETLRDCVEEFSRRPVGSGPYCLAEAIEPDAAQVRFTANPYYRGAERPAIREIVFHRMDAIEAEEQFMSGKLQLIYGVQKEQVTRLTQAGKEVRQLSPPTITFLAPNHRSRLVQNEDVRLAVAHAIDRESILDQYFRPGGRENDHRPLTGPFPPGSWACDPGVADFNPEIASVHAKEAMKDLGTNQIKLRLSYPAGSLDVESACKRIADDVRNRTGIQLELERLEPGRFYDQVTQYHNFDFAYWSHTFEDSTYWLEPLLDLNAASREPGGPNFMGYAPDQDLATLFQDLRRHKQFRQIEHYAQEIHKHVAREAVIVPLWQLDTYVAVSERLENVTLDPLTFYGDIQHWTIATRRPSF